jgi:Rho guanine nucleotide exchange factor 10
MLFIFSEPEKGRVLGRIPLDSPAACLTYKAAKVWVGATDGYLTTFTRGSTAAMAAPEYHIAARVATIKLGAGCVAAMVAAAADSGAALYAACGLRVSVLDVDSMEVVRTFTVTLPPPPQLSAELPADSAVSHLALAGSGLIAAVSSRPLLLLYHTETLVLVQHMDIAHSLPATAATTVKNHNNGRETSTATAVRITALTAGPRDVLWIGTSRGLVLTLPLPRMSCGLPLLSAGTGHVSRHAHRGPVRFVVEVPPAAEAAKRRGGGRVGGGGGGEGQPRIPCLMVAPPPPVENEQQGPLTSSSPPAAAAAEEQTAVKMSLKSGGGTPRMRIQRKSHDNHNHNHNSVAERRASKTLPRGFSLSGYRAVATNDDYEDDEAPTTAESMLQLYGELVNVRGDYADCSGIGPPPDFSGRRKNGGGDAQEGDNCGGNLHQQRHSSDPDLAVIPYRVSTLDRRISMKLTRARSLDLSSWSLGSRTSSWTTSSSSGMHTHLHAQIDG